MKDFYGGNGYEIVDRENNFTPEEITFANVWGVCDEGDMAKKAIGEMNKDSKAG